MEQNLNWLHLQSDLHYQLEIQKERTSVHEKGSMKKTVYSKK